MLKDQSIDSKGSEAQDSAVAFGKAMRSGSGSSGTASGSALPAVRERRGEERGRLGLEEGGGWGGHDSGGGVRSRSPSLVAGVRSVVALSAATDVFNSRNGVCCLCCANLK